MKKPARTLMVVLWFLGTSYLSLTQQEKESISQSEKEALVKTLCARIEKIYIFTEKTNALCDQLKANLQNGTYKNAASPREFALRLNEDIESITHDKHFGIQYDPQQAEEMAEQSGKNTSFYTPRLVEQYRRLNYGFKEAKILAGNIGYLDLRDFFPLRWAADAAIASMNFLSNCDALIIDLRYNGGGEDQTVTFLLSYFLDSRESTITFNTAYTKFDDSYYQAATWPYVPGKTLYNTPLYLLTSRSSFSGAEAFAFRLKSRKRAMLVGETTRGGAHPVEIQEIGGKYIVYIPSTKNVGSLAVADWEGVGVQPDIEVPATQALETAHETALNALADKAADDNQRAYYEWTLAGFKAIYQPLTVQSSLLRAYAGEYGDWLIRFEDNELYLQRGGRTKLRMIAVDENLFLIDTQDNYRLRFTKNMSGDYSLEALYVDGRVIPLKKGPRPQF